MNRFQLLDDTSSETPTSPLAQLNLDDKADSHQFRSEQGLTEAKAVCLPSTTDTAAQTASSGSRSKFKIKNPIVWMDLEMTGQRSAGLNPDTDQILELAVLITDGDLSGPHLEGPELVIHQSDEVLEHMNEWCIKTHGENGLTQKCRDSKISLQAAEAQVLEFLEKHTAAVHSDSPAMYKAHLAGNSIYMDRAFLRKNMPLVDAHLHWRLIDVSTVLELARRWFPSEFKKAPKKKAQHTAMADIRESLAELKFYRRAIFKMPSHN